MVAVVATVPRAVVVAQVAWAVAVQTKREQAAAVALVAKAAMPVQAQAAPVAQALASGL
jgi:hypothetical protein